MPEGTPQNAGLARRFAAVLYDCLLVLAVLVLIAGIFLIVTGGDAEALRKDLFYRFTLVGTIYLFFVGYWSRVGRTLGMQSWGLQLETVDGKIPSPMAATVRFFAAMLSWAVAGLGFFWQLWDPEKLTWHDHLSKTRLVHYPRRKK